MKRAERRERGGKMMRKKRTVEELEKELRKKEAEIARIKGLFNREYEFEVHPKNPFLLMQVGSEKLGWIPADRYFMELTKKIKLVGLDKRYNIILCNAFVSAQRLS